MFLCYFFFFHLAEKVANLLQGKANHEDSVRSKVPWGPVQTIERTLAAQLKSEGHWYDCGALYSYSVKIPTFSLAGDSVQIKSEFQCRIIPCRLSFWIIAGFMQFAENLWNCLRILAHSASFGMWWALILALTCLFLQCPCTSACMQNFFVCKYRDTCVLKSDAWAQSLTFRSKEDAAFPTTQALHVET